MIDPIVQRITNKDGSVDALQMIQELIDLKAALCRARNLLSSSLSGDEEARTAALNCLNDALTELTSDGKHGG